MKLILTGKQYMNTNTCIYDEKVSFHSSFSIINRLFFTSILIFTFSSALKGNALSLDSSAGM